ncbi:MAG: hypothetical protein WBA99_00440 [Nodosilinea sp.]
MPDREFDSPPLVWAVLPVVGGIATGIGLIWALESFGDRLRTEPQRAESTFQQSFEGIPQGRSAQL